MARAATEVAEVAGWAAAACWAVKEAQEVVWEAKGAKGALGLEAAAGVGAAAMVAATVVLEHWEVRKASASHRSSLHRTSPTPLHSGWTSIRGPPIWRLANRRRTSP